MSDFFRKNLKEISVFAASIVITFLLLLIFIPKAEPLMKVTQLKSQQSGNKEVIHYVAVGDSLTEGIGDSTNSGGFVPLLAKSLQDEFKLNGVETDNFGKSGDRSDQILKRIKKLDDIQQGLSTADIITLTVGGNDLMAVIKGDVFNLTQESFNKPMKTYQQNLQKLFKEIRKYNETAPIYVVGIYNPLYLYFSEITEMQDIVNNWNAGTQAIVDEQKNSFFIPINDLLYKGTNSGVAIVNDGATDTSSSGVTNDALYEVDRFHPNNLGYQIMASAIKEEVSATQEFWLPKEKESE